MLITTATSSDERERSASVAVLPIGAFEQHGDFLPLTTDTIIACVLAKRLADDYGLFLLPPITLSCSHEHASFAGTVSISAQTLAATVGDVAASLELSGTNRLVLVNAHGGNYVLSNVVQQANVAGPRMALFPSREDWHTARAAAALESSSSEDMHAGELEVSLLLHAEPELVRSSYGRGDWHAEHRSHLLAVGMRGYSDSGVIGRPSLATAEKGRLLLNSLSKSFENHLNVLQGKSG